MLLTSVRNSSMSSRRSAISVLTSAISAFNSVLTSAISVLTSAISVLTSAISAFQAVEAVLYEGQHGKHQSTDERGDDSSRAAGQPSPVWATLQQDGQICDRDR